MTPLSFQEVALVNKYLKYNDLSTNSIRFPQLKRGLPGVTVQAEEKVQGDHRFQAYPSCGREPTQSAVRGHEAEGSLAQ